MTFVEFDTDRITPGGRQWTRDPCLDVSRTGKVTPYQMAKLKALLSWDKRLGARPIDNPEMPFPGNHRAQVQEDPAARLSVPPEGPVEVENPLPAYGAPADYVVEETPAPRSPMDVAIEEFGRTEITVGSEAPGDDKVSIHSGVAPMDDEVFYRSRLQPNQLHSTLTLSPPFRTLNSYPM